MTTALPALITWPALTVMVIVVVVRYVWFNATRMEAYLNHTLALLVFSNVLRERAIQDFLAGHGLMSVTTAQQLSLAVVIFAAAEFMGFVAVWADPVRYMERHRNLVHRVMALALAAGFLIAAGPARRAGMTLEEFGGWSSVLAWALLITNLVMLAAQILRMSLAEVRSGLKSRDRLVAMAGVGLGVVIGTTSLNALVLALLDQLGIAETTPLMLQVHGTNIFFEAVAVTALASLPIVMSASGVLAQDGPSRFWRALQPLLNDLEDVVPPTTFRIRSGRRRKTNLDLHQTNVAIRDAILALRPYFREIEPERMAEVARWTSRPRQREGAIWAVYLADALAARAAGDPPNTDEDTAAAVTAVVQQARDLEDETTEMLRLARWWDRAKTSTAEYRRTLTTTTEGATR